MDFKGFKGIKRELMGFLGILRNSKEIQGILWDFIKF